MKYIMRTPLLIICFIIIFIIGCFIGYDVSSDFTLLYVSKLTQIPARYTLLILIIFANYIVFNQLNCTAILLRKKSLFSSLLSIVRVEVIVLFLLFIFLHLPILFQNGKQAFNNMYLIIKIIMNGVIVSLFLISSIKLVDVKLKNRAIASGVVLVFFALLDMLLQHFNFFVVNESLFDFSYIFSLPYIYSNYYILALGLIITTIVLTALSTFLFIKKDYFLGSSYEEN